MPILRMSFGDARRRGPNGGAGGAIYISGNTVTMSEVNKSYPHR